MHPLNLRRSPKDYKVTFNRNMTLETGQITLSVNEMENNLSAPLLSVGTSTLGPPPFSIYLHNQKQKMHFPNGLSTIQTAHKTKMTVFSVDAVKSLCGRVLRSVLAVAESFGTGTILWYKAKQEEEQARRSFTHLIRSLNWFLVVGNFL